MSEENQPEVVESTVVDQPVVETVTDHAIDIFPKESVGTIDQEIDALAERIDLELEGNNRVMALKKLQSVKNLCME